MRFRELRDIEEVKEIHNNCNQNDNNNSSNELFNESLLSNIEKSLRPNK